MNIQSMVKRSPDYPIALYYSIEEVIDTHKSYSNYRLSRRPTIYIPEKNRYDYTNEQDIKTLFYPDGELLNTNKPTKYKSIQAFKLDIHRIFETYKKNKNETPRRIISIQTHISRIEEYRSEYAKYINSLVESNHKTEISTYIETFTKNVSAYYYANVTSDNSQLNADFLKENPKYINVEKPLQQMIDEIVNPSVNSSDEIVNPPDEIGKQSVNSSDKIVQSSNTASSANASPDNPIIKPLSELLTELAELNQPRNVKGNKIKDFIFNSIYKTQLFQLVLYTYLIDPTDQNTLKECIKTCITIQKNTKYNINDDIDFFTTIFYATIIKNKYGFITNILSSNQKFLPYYALLFNIKEFVNVETVNSSGDNAKQNVDTDNTLRVTAESTEKHNQPQYVVDKHWMGIIKEKSIFELYQIHKILLNIQSTFYYNFYILCILHGESISYRFIKKTDGTKEKPNTRMEYAIKLPSIHKEGSNTNNTNSSNANNTNSIKLSNIFDVTTDLTQNTYKYDATNPNNNDYYIAFFKKQFVDRAPEINEPEPEYITKCLQHAEKTPYRYLSGLIQKYANRETNNDNLKQIIRGIFHKLDEINALFTNPIFDFTDPNKDAERIKGLKSTSSYIKLNTTWLLSQPSNTNNVANQIVIDNKIQNAIQKLNTSTYKSLLMFTAKSNSKKEKPESTEEKSESKEEKSEELSNPNRIVWNLISDLIIKWVDLFYTYKYTPLGTSEQPNKPLYKSLYTFKKHEVIFRMKILLRILLVKEQNEFYNSSFICSDIEQIIERPDQEAFPPPPPPPNNVKTSDPNAFPPPPPTNEEMMGIVSLVSSNIVDTPAYSIIPDIKVSDTHIQTSVLQSVNTIVNTAVNNALLVLTNDKSTPQPTTLPKNENTDQPINSLLSEIRDYGIKSSKNDTPPSTTEKAQQVQPYIDTFSKYIDELYSKYSSTASSEEYDADLQTNVKNARDILEIVKLFRSRFDLFSNTSEDTESLFKVCMKAKAFVSKLAVDYLSHANSVNSAVVTHPQDSNKSIQQVPKANDTKTKPTIEEVLKVANELFISGTVETNGDQSKQSSTSEPLVYNYSGIPIDAKTASRLSTTFTNLNRAKLLSEIRPFTVEPEQPQSKQGNNVPYVNEDTLKESLYLDILNDIINTPKNERDTKDYTYERRNKDEAKEALTKIIKDIDSINDKNYNELGSNSVANEKNNANYITRHPEYKLLDKYVVKKTQSHIGNPEIADLNGTITGIINHIKQIYNLSGGYTFYFYKYVCIKLILYESSLKADDLKTINYEKSNIQKYLLSLSDNENIYTLYTNIYPLYNAIIHKYYVPASLISKNSSMSSTRLYDTILKDINNENVYTFKYTPPDTDSSAKKNSKGQNSKKPQSIRTEKPASQTYTYEVIPTKYEVIPTNVKKLGYPTMNDVIRDVLGIPKKHQPTKRPTDEAKEPVSTEYFQNISYNRVGMMDLMVSQLIKDKTPPVKVEEKTSQPAILRSASSPQIPTQYNNVRKYSKWLDSVISKRMLSAVSFNNSAHKQDSQSKPEEITIENLEENTIQYSIIDNKDDYTVVNTEQ
jgi:hypothetical protein